ncbi:LysR family transcriptional regulator [Labrys neptuniae]|uniref:LysR family transcriptional regulator n=1 Tax=Labrys neptuniae TaxID=376174 RepID=UPI002890B5B5|nr:LysR family transcriptional regulator [Labrys neptuniae]MDT3380751.1 LysR family transcriptional regulator [Labrys neptuniae]
MTTLDVDAVKAFVMVADLQSFTRAAEALASTQATISVKLRRLEEKLGARLIERTPRRVRLSPRGAAFLPAARDFIAAHERAIAEFASAPCRLSLGFVDHVAGPELPALLAQLNAHDPTLTLKVKIDTTTMLMAALDEGGLDAVIVHNEDDRRPGTPLSATHYGWYAAPHFEWCREKPLPLAMLSMCETCPDRLRSTEALERAGLAWSETFVGGGGSALNLAVSAGVAVAALAHRVAPPGVIEVSAKLGLPPLPPSQIILHCNALSPRARDALRILTTAFREHRTT